jgi:hypothetical protein
MTARLTCAADIAALQVDLRTSIRSQPTIRTRTAYLMSGYPASGTPVSKLPCAAVAASVLQQRLRPACDSTALAFCVLLAANRRCRL